MKRLICVGVGVLGMMCAMAFAEPQAASQDAQKGKAMTVTGCLAKGADATSFMLSDAMPEAAAKEQSKDAAKSGDKRSYHVTAEPSVKLTDHVGHTVTLTGTVAEGAGGGAKAGATGGTGTSGTAGKAGAMSHLTVTSMKHVAGTCKS
jgi:hypothetical protein